MKIEKSPARSSSFSSPIARSSHLRSSNSTLTSGYSPLRRSSSHFAPSSPASSSTSQFREPAIENTTATTNSLRRKYTSSSLLASPSRSTVGTISRSDTFASEYEQGNPHKWTKQHWRKLEQCYLRKNRDYEKAASEFYYIESLQDILLPDRDSIDGKPIRKELWSKEQILWRCKCLDTSAKFHGGLLPSERKKIKKLANTSPSSASTVAAGSTLSESSSSAEKLRNLSVLIETSLGDLVIDLYTEECPKTTLNFLKLCKIKYYNFSPFFNVQKDFMAQTGDPTGKGDQGESIYGILNGPSQRYFPAEISPKLKHKKKGMVSMAVAADASIESGGVSGSQFFITLADDLDYLDGKYTLFGEVAEGFEVLDKMNEAFCDEKGRPYRDIRIKHTVILDDPFPDPEGLQVPDESPLPTKEQMESMRIADDEDIEEFGDPEEIEKKAREREAKAHALTLEMIGDLPFAEVKPPENVLFVCKLNPVTRDEDLEMIFSRFGAIHSCEIIRDRQTGDSLSYAFVEFENKEDAEEAYFKMQSVLIDDRRIHVDFSQSVSKLHKDWISKRTGGKGESMGGFDNLQKRTRYRDGDESKGQNYDLVFDTDKRDQKRHRGDEQGSRRRDDDRQRRGDDRKRDDNRLKDDRRDSRRDDRRDYNRNKDDDRRDRRRDDDRRRSSKR
ncbi:RNA binding protein [Mucor ambiguus]|uniref:Peptidyl-prolyl cis-trans isomerase n=1 Tax=Mucor ambiguus TaxID=91626 RepID=A0A0C9M9C9_9FUNG|nr:RNA binding protein [Mucor ambiguus]